MCYRLTALLGVGLLGLGMLAQAQDFDDIYYDGSESSKPTEKVITTPVRTSQSRSGANITPRRYRIPANSGSSAARSDDEYNRRGAYSRSAMADSSSSDSAFIEGGKFANTERIERFYDPNVVSGSGDDELITLYYDTTPTVNIVVGSTFPTYDWGWGVIADPWYASWYGPSWSWSWSWSSPWYSTWYDPWFGSNWAWRHSWCDPWFGSDWAWHHPWHDSWFRPSHPWGGPGWGHGYYAGNGRRPGAGASYSGTNVSGGRRPNYYTSNGGSTSVGSRRPSSSASYSGNGRYSSTNVSGGRPGYAVGNVGSGAVTSYSRRPSSTVNNSTFGQSRPGYATQQPSRSSYESRSTSRSFERSSSSSSWGGGSGSFSGGGFSGGRSGGGFSGGGGHRR